MKFQGFLSRILFILSKLTSISCGSSACSFMFVGSFCSILSQATLCTWFVQLFFNNLFTVPWTSRSYFWMSLMLDGFPSSTARSSTSKEDKPDISSRGFQVALKH